MGEAQQGEERQKAKLGKEPSKLVAAVKRLTLNFEAEPIEAIPLFEIPHLGPFEKVKLEFGGTISIAEVKLKEPPEGETEEEKKQTTLAKIRAAIQKGNLIESALGYFDKSSNKIMDGFCFGKPKDDWGEGITPEFKFGRKGARDGEYEVELNLHDTWEFPKAQPTPVEIEASVIPFSLNASKGEVEIGVLQGEGSFKALQLTDGDFGNIQCEAVTLEGKITFSATIDRDKLAEFLRNKAKPVAKAAWNRVKASASDAWDEISKRGPEAYRAVSTWVDENVSLVVSEDGELVATPALDLVMTATVVVLVVVALAASLNELKLEADIDALDAERKKRVDNLASYYVQGLQGQHLDHLAQWGENDAFQAGRKRREELGGGDIDSWLQEHEQDVVDEAKKQFRIVISDALWAGFADGHSTARDLWQAWVVLYGGGTEPFALKKMDLFLKYAKSPWGAPDGWASGKWTQYGVHQYFLDKA